MHLVVDEHGAGKRRLQPAGEPDPLPAAELRRQGDPAGRRVDDAGRADADRLQTAPLDSRGGKDLVGRVADEVEQRVGGLPLESARPSTNDAEHLAREVGRDDQHLVRADVDAEHMTQIAAEAEEASARPRAARAGVEVGNAFGQVPGLEQDLHRAVDGRLGQAGRSRELRTGDGPVGSDRAQHRRRVEPTEEPW